MQQGTDQFSSAAADMEDTSNKTPNQSNQSILYINHREKNYIEGCKLHTFLVHPID